MPEEYRTPNLPAGFFSRTGNLHMHVDGGEHADDVLQIFKHLEQMGAAGKLHVIADSVAGPQRALLPETYASHTPEEFNYFATVSLGSREKAVSTLRQMLPALTQYRGLVVEVERVIRTSHFDTLLWEISMVSPEARESITVEEVGVPPSSTLPYEIHHGFELPVDKPLPLIDLLQDTTALGVMVGGWFCFKRADVLRYRSNSFSEGLVPGDPIGKERQALAYYLQSKGYDCGVRTVVEEVLGIWRT